MFYIKKISDFKIKKAKGIFLYNFTQNKIKYLSNFESIFTFSSKRIKTHFKNYLSKGWGLPFYNIIKEKENLLKILFFNKSLFKFYGPIEIYENKKLLDSNLKKSLNHSSRNIFFDFQKNNLLLSFVNKISSNKFISINESQKIVTTLFYQDYKNNDTNIIENSIIHIDGFPYYFDDFNLKKIKLLILRQGNQNKFNEFFSKVLKQYFYFSINFNLTLFDQNLENDKIDKTLTIYFENDFYKYKKYLIENRIKQFYFQPFFINYLIVMYHYMELVKFLKSKKNIIILDESKTGFRFFPFSLFFNFNNIYKNISEGNNIFKTNDYFDIYIAGNNLSTGLYFNFYIITDSFFNNNIIKNSDDTFFTPENYNPFAIETFKYSYLYLKQTLIFKEFYKNLETLEYDFSFINNPLDNQFDFFSIVGPYIKIYPDLKIKNLDTKFSKLKNLVPFKTDDLKILFLNVFKIFCNYNYGVLPVDMGQPEILSLKSVFKKYKEIFKI